MAIAALCRGLDLGMNHINTAQMCGNGTAECIVGEAITGRRDEVFLVADCIKDNEQISGRRSWGENTAEDRR
jgi:aryl-alcohol dehydrogenase-like predicted oxidoreductase